MNDPVLMAGAFARAVDAGRGVEIRDGNGNRILLDSSGGIQIEAAGTVSLSASTLQVSASSMTVDAATSTFAGVVTCDTMIAKSVEAESYTPGAGNVW